MTLLDEARRLFPDHFTVSETGCWEWYRAMGGDRRSYAYVSKFGRYGKAHRIAYELLVGPVPDGLVLDHLCRVRHCINPDHLEPVTIRENTLRGQNFIAKQAAQTHCKRGHEFSAENTRLYRGSRVCRACQAERNARAA